ncbi:MAG: aminotransferase class I/II-fold pyridoxal phosphate-dependent enzyme [Bacteroidia bacterium]
MSTSTIEKMRDLKVSQMAETLIGSEIIKLAAEVNEKIKNGEKIYNLTIGDFNPKMFPIPNELKAAIIEEYTNNETNYPAASGMPALINSVAHFLKKRQELDFKADEILISGGARPLIYATYQALIDPNDSILFPVPSWNNNHYTHLSYANCIMVETKMENNFMPTAEELKPHIQKAAMLAVCSPLNPTGTTFTKKGLEEICDLILAENKRRGENEKPLYLLFDQVYWMLTFSDTKHFNPITLRPEMKNYTIFIDGISKAFAATGVRVGWAMGPKKVIDKMKAILSHVGAWSPKAEQLATAKFLVNDAAVDHFLNPFKQQIFQRLDSFYKGFMELKNEGFSVNAIAPQAAIYLTVQIKLQGKKTADGKILHDTKDVTKYILDEAKIAIVPFYAFGSSGDSAWYRLSVGTASMEDIKGFFENLKNALKKLS